MNMWSVNIWQGSNDKSDRIKGDLGTLRETSLKVDTQRREWNTAPLGSKEMELEQGSLHTHPWDCLGLPLYATASTSCSSSWNLPPCLYSPLQVFLMTLLFISAPSWIHLILSPSLRLSGQQAQGLLELVLALPGFLTQCQTRTLSQVQINLWLLSTTPAAFSTWAVTSVQ